MAPRIAGPQLPARPRHASSRVLGVALLGSAAVLVATLPAAAAAPSSPYGPAALTTNDVAGSAWRVVPGARPGALISRDGIAVVVPRAGLGVSGSALMADGTELALSVRSTPDGRVMALDMAAPGDAATSAAGSAGVTPGATVAVGQSAPTPAAEDVCQDRAFNLTGSWWHATTVRWSFRASSTPAELRPRPAARALKLGAGDITHERNSCGRADHVSASSAYLGTTSTQPNIAAPDTCLGNGDGQNVVGFGDLGPGIVAFSCWWFSGTVNVEADMLLNKHDFDWTTTLSGCSNAYLVQAIATHEFGHIYGLAHVSEAHHPLLTMSAAAATCDDSPSTLGLGDMLGLERHY